MKVLYKGIAAIWMLCLLIGGLNTLKAQIFEPEGINLPGTWNNFTNPPAAGSAFGSSTQVLGGVTPISVGQRRWQTTIHIAELGADTSAGAYTWLFTSGPTSNPYGNKWAGVNVVMNTIQDYLYNSGADNSITVENDKYYTINWQDQGYQASRAIVMETSGNPVNFNSIAFLPNSGITSADPVFVTATLSSNPSVEEKFYLRYSLDNFATSVIVPMTVAVSSASVTIPAQPNGATVSFYAFSTTINNPTADFDIISLNFINNGDSGNFSYSVNDLSLSVNLGNDTVICASNFPLTLEVDDIYDSYLWSTGDETASILVDATGQYWVEVSQGGLIARDTVVVSLSSIPPISLGDDIVQCSNAPIVLSPGVSIGEEDGLLTIIYDASQGQSGLTGASTVYMHSTYEVIPFGGPVLPFVGNWGEDDGLGQMTNIGEDLWSITIDPFIYYSIPQNITSISGLIMVFRNADGSAEGKDDNGNDIFLNLQGASPSSTFGGVTASYIDGSYNSIEWSNGSITETITVTESGIYSATVTTSDGCTFTDEIEVTFGDFVAPDLPSSISICEGSVSLDAGVGYSTYLWSTNQTTQQIEASESGTYSVTVSNAEGCTASDSTLVIITSSIQFSLGNDTSICGDGSIQLSTGLSISAAGDSLTIRYDASQGVGNLEGLSTVYMHSGMTFTPQGSWTNTVGNWGQDDGIGRMTQDENSANIWTITINPYSYYGVTEGVDFEGIWMVFRNIDGTLTGKNESNQDIYVNATAYPSLSSAFSGVTASVQAGAIAQVLWSTGATSSSIVVSETGIYWAEIGEGDCAFRDSIEVTFIELPELGLSSDTTFCGNVEPYTISANAGFDTYSWSTGVNTNAIVVSAVGTYLLTASIGECSITDSVNVQSSLNAGIVNLGEDAVLCGNESLVLSPGVSISPEGDSLTITYDATQGQTGLVGAASVYMHSTYESVPFGGPVTPWTGNWGLDDGIGQMTQVGTNLWSITFNVFDYYGITPGTPVNGLFMVFRNADGTAEGKDNNGNDIFLDLSGAEPNSSFAGISAQIESSAFNGILWSNGATTPSISVSQAGTYSVTLFGNTGCNVSDTIVVTTSAAPSVNLGPNQTLCGSQPIALNAGPGFASYSWGHGPTTQNVNIFFGGNYTVTVTNEAGCSASDNITITENAAPNAAFTWVETAGLTIAFTPTASSAGNSFAWDFTTNGTIDNTSSGNVNFTYPSVGQYQATLTVTNECGTNSSSQNLALIGLGINNSIALSGLEISPNPSSDYISLNSDRSIGTIQFFNSVGQLVKQVNVSAEKQTSISVQELSNGVYFIKQLENSNSKVIRFVKN